MQADNHEWYLVELSSDGWQIAYCRQCGRKVKDFIAGGGRDQIVLSSGDGPVCSAREPRAITPASFLSDVSAELARAQRLHGPMHSMHEGYAVILEELDEVKAHVWLKQSSRDPAAVYKELVQLGAMVARMAVECGADDFKK